MQSATNANVPLWHSLRDEEIEKQLSTNFQKGLTPEEVQRRLVEFGENRLTVKRQKAPWQLFVSQLNQPLVYILLCAMFVTFLLSEWVDGSVILAVVLVNAIVGFLQEMKAVKAIESLSRSMEGWSVVIRGGHKEKVKASQLVPGDIVLLQSGDKVPADLRLIRCRELQVDESALTGESVPIQKRLDELASQIALADRVNMAYSTALVTFGTASGVVVAIGDKTEIGQINELIANAVSLETPLTQKINEFSGLLLKLILVLAGLTIAAGLFHGGDLVETFMAAVALAVGAIPEGLPAAMTIMLAIGVNSMARRNAIIRKMPAVETLGSTTVICSDKTGTLTQNQMTVQEIFAGNVLYEVTGTGYAPVGEITQGTNPANAPEHVALVECLRIGMLCNDTQLVEREGIWRVEGDPTEAALLSVAGKIGLQRHSLDADYQRLDVLPFESAHQYMATLHAHEGQQIIYVKGSIESILSRCETCYLDDAKIDPLNKQQILQEAEKMATQGLRVLAFARKLVNGKQKHVHHEHLNDDLCFVGLQGMLDPPRPEAIAAIKACHLAGIKVKMITGDHLSTASAIATKLGLQSSDASADFAISGSAISEFSDEALLDVVGNKSVFARVTPEHKLRLVRALQAQGHVVAMTGDGVNDAPALKQANIGIAMGLGGTEVAKESADMVLTDDNFATIEAAVEEGRVVFDNLVKFITWTLPTNIGEGLVILVAVFGNLTLPITPVQILWINMTTAILLGMMLSFEAKEPGVMKRPPRQPDTPIITRELAIRMATVACLLLVGAFGLFQWALLRGDSLEIARTIAVNTFVFGELFYLFNCRSLRLSMLKLGVFSNRWLLLGVATMIVMQLFMTYSSLMNEVFGTAPISMLDWSWILVTGLAIYFIVEFEKTLRRRRDHHKQKALIP